MHTGTATRISIICSTVAALLRTLPEQPLRSQLIDLADAAESESDILRLALADDSPALVSIK